MSDAKDKLERLQAERAQLAATRTREDIRTRCESSLASAFARLNGSTRYFLNESVLPEHLLAVIAEFDVATRGASLLDYIVADNTPPDAPSDRQKKQRLAKFDEQIARLTVTVRDEAKAEALAAVEAEFAVVSGEAA